jgi:hypothetical protein
VFNSIKSNDEDGIQSITFGDNGKGTVKGFGKITISNDLSIFNVLLVESLNFNLLSVAQLCDLGFKCIFGVDDVEIISVDGSNLIFKGFRYENLYLIDFNASETQFSTCLITKSSMVWLWHRRLGHVGMKQLNKLVKHDLVRGLKDVTFEKDKLCSACQAGKQVGNTYPKKSIISTSKAFELLHMDLFRPTTYTSISGNKYEFVIVDDFTRYTWCSFLLTKVMCLQPSRHSSREFTMSLKPPSRKWEMTIEVNSRTQELMVCVMNLGLGINSRPSTLLNQMA